MHRYRGIIPRWDEFIEISRLPLPKTIRVNTLKISVEELTKRLSAKGWKLKRCSFCDYFFEVECEDSIANAIEHWLGLYYIQEATSLIAPLALDPKPNEVILDLCAAPGGKTTHMAQIMGNRGLIVANDVKGKRLRALMANVYRMGLINTIVTAYSGFFFPDGFKFDKAIVDVPCSGEGNLRKDPKRINGAEPRFIKQISGLQKGLLLKAIDLVKPGGVIVYSTCTFAPEENEAVVQHALKKRDVVLEEIKEVDIPCCRGLDRWEDLKFDRKMYYTLRIYPHHFNSGGGYVAKLRKLS